jgi:Family of unknown function (DUF5678)
VRKYEGKYIAVYRGKLVAVGDSYKEVYEEAERQGIEEPPLTMQVPGIEDWKPFSDPGVAGGVWPTF